MKWIIYCIWAITSDNYFEQNMLAVKITETIFGVPASIQFAQAIYESGKGKSYIAKHSNNHFGIRYYKETFKGKYFIDRAGNKWRAYNSVFESYLDHSYFIYKHYNSACFGNYLRFKGAKGYGGIKYWERIIKLIIAQNLYKYDNIYRG